MIGPQRWLGCNIKILNHESSTDMVRSVLLCEIKLQDVILGHMKMASVC